MREFVEIDLDREPALDETTIRKFRYLLQSHDLGRSIFERVRVHLQAGFRLSTGTIVDATLIAAPSATKNRSNVRARVEHVTEIINGQCQGALPRLG